MEPGGATHEADAGRGMAYDGGTQARTPPLCLPDRRRLDTGSPGTRHHAQRSRRARVVDPSELNFPSGPSGHREFERDLLVVLVVPAAVLHYDVPAVVAHGDEAEGA